ncbi:MAG: hypothetical protein R3E32_18655 [Chitinophagales bacterium]
MDKDTNNFFKDQRILNLLSFIVKATSILVVLLMGAIFWVFYTDTIAPHAQKLKAEREQIAAVQQKAIAENPIKDGIHVATGFAEGEGLEMVIATCTACHSAKLVTQNRATREGWEQMIRWMQATQNLWDLGEQEEIILNYLAKHYAPENTGRRKLLTDVEWYELEEE